MSEQKYAIDPAEAQRLQDQHNQVQRDLENLPAETRAFVKAAQKAVDHEVQMSNDFFFNDSLYATDRFLIAHNLPGQAREELHAAVQRTPKGAAFAFYGKAFVRTYRDEVLTAQNYIRSLEDAIIRLSRQAAPATSIEPAPVKCPMPVVKPVTKRKKRKPKKRIKKL